MLWDKITGVCHACKKDKAPSSEDRLFSLERAVDDKTGEVLDVLKCRICGEMVPLESWKHYQKTGDIVVKRKKGKK